MKKKMPMMAPEKVDPKKFKTEGHEYDAKRPKRPVVSRYKG